MKFGKLIGLVGVVALVYLLWLVRQVLLLAFAAIAFATVINKLVQQLQKLSIPRGLAVAIALLSIGATLVGTGWLVLPALIDRIPEYTFLSEQGIERVQQWYNHLAGIVPGDALAATELGDLLPQLARMSPTWVGRLVTIFAGSLDFVINFLLVLATTIMLLANPAAYRRVLLLIFPKFYRPRADAILTLCEQALAGWAVGILFNMTVITVCSAIGLAIIGVPLPVVNAVIAGLLTFIPTIGPFLSVLPPMLMALAIQPWMAIAVLILYFAIQQIEGTVLTPLVMKKQVSLLPAITLIAQVICAIFFGLLGLFLALPIVVVTQVWAKELLVKDILNQWPAPSHRPTRWISAKRKALESY
ncbi:MAG: AI-2E family transporter [Cyanobacteria bacterium J06597_16]